MRQSALFTKTRRKTPTGEVSKNADLLVRAGFIHKEAAGVFSFLPLGLKVLNRIIAIIRDEMAALGAEEVLLSTLQDPDVWKRSGRWEDSELDVWFKTSYAAGGVTGLATTHEEPLANALRDHVQSYRDLPFSVFQIQTKFRNELRAKSGLLRTREFLMKDLYSFSRDVAEHNAFYEKVKNSYARIFDLAGIGEGTHLTYASGGSFTKFSHEFQTVTDAGEDTIYLDEASGIAVNAEVLNDRVLSELNITHDTLVQKKAIEVGNIFSLGTRFSEALGLTFKDERGESTFPVMGSYGIGPARLMGTVVELLSDDLGIVWPASIAPFDAHVLALGAEGKGVHTETEKTVMELERAGASVLYDDRAVSAGEKFSDADLIGIPVRIIVSEKTLASKSAEVKRRTEKVGTLISLSALTSNLTER